MIRTTLLLGALLLVGCTSPSGYRTFQVVDGETGQGVADARVWLLYSAPFETPSPNTSGRTDETGHVRLHIADIGRQYTLRVDAQSYPTSRFPSPRRPVPEGRVHVITLERP